MSSFTAITQPIVEYGDGTSSLVVQLPTAGGFKVESVYAEIDTSAGNGSPELTMTHPSGEVAARKAQTLQLTAGAPGESATWALRLADETGGGGGTVDRIVSPDHTITVTNPTGPTVDIVVPRTSAVELVEGGGGVAPGNGTVTPLSWAHSLGAHLLNYANPLAPTVLTSGIYAVTVIVTHEDAIFNLPGQMVAYFNMGSLAFTWPQRGLCQLDTTGPGLAPGFGLSAAVVSLSRTQFLNAGQSLTASVAQDSGSPTGQIFALTAYVTQVGRGNP